MKRQLVLLLVGCALAAPGFAGETKKKQNKEAIGIGSGAVIGAAAGGPVGLILGAAFGGWLGDRFQHEQDQRLELAQRYDEARAEIVALEGTVLRGEREAARLETQLLAEQRAHRSTLQEAIDVQVLFRTDASALDADAEERLMRIGRIVASMSGVTVRLAGHTDGRGSEEYNRELAEQRALAVRDVLMRAGVPEERVELTAEGKRYATAETTDQDAMALERRVHMQLTGDGATDRRMVRR